MEIYLEISTERLWTIQIEIQLRVVRRVKFSQLEILHMGYCAFPFKFDLNPDYKQLA